MSRIFQWFMTIVLAALGCGLFWLSLVFRPTGDLFNVFFSYVFLGLATLACFSAAYATMRMK